MLEEVVLVTVVLVLSRSTRFGGLRERVNDCRRRIWKHVPCTALDTIFRWANRKHTPSSVGLKGSILRKRHIVLGTDGPPSEQFCCCGVSA